MKPTLLSALVASALLASGAALACDDMKMTDDGDGGRVRERPVASADQNSANAAVPINMSTVKQKQPAKQKSAGKPIAPGSATLVKTGS